jgi:hypothetical protein
VALANIMRLSLKKGAHAAVSSAAWQEIRVRSGRDDNFVEGSAYFSRKKLLTIEPSPFHDKACALCKIEW